MAVGGEVTLRLGLNLILAQRQASERKRAIGARPGLPHELTPRVAQRDRGAGQWLDQIIAHRAADEPIYRAPGDTRRPPAERKDTQNQRPHPPRVRPW